MNPQSKALAKIEEARTMTMTPTVALVISRAAMAVETLEAKA